MAQYIQLSIVLSGLMLFWAFTARRFVFDGTLLIALAGLHLILAALWPLILPALWPQMSSSLLLNAWPLLSVGVLGLVMFVRAFISDLDGLHRVGLGFVGFALILLLIAVTGMILLYGTGNDHDHSRPPIFRSNEN